MDREQAALHAAEDNFGPYHPNTVLVLNDLAAIYWTMGRYEDSEETYKWALAVREKTLGKDDLLVADSLNNLAALYEDLGRDPEAKMAEERAIRIVEKKEGGLTPDCGLEMLILGKIQINLQDNLGAEKTLDQAVSLGAKTQNNNPGQYCESLVALAQANQASGHLQIAETHLKQYLDSCGKQYKADSVEVADSLECLGDFYKAEHLKKKSREYYESALKIYRKFVAHYPFCDRHVQEPAIIGVFHRSAEFGVIWISSNAVSMSTSSFLELSVPPKTESSKHDRQSVLIKNFSVFFAKAPLNLFSSFSRSFEYNFPIYIFRKTGLRP